METAETLQGEENQEPSGTAAFEQLLAPRAVEPLRDLVAPAEILHRQVAAETGNNDLENLRYPRSLNVVSSSSSGPS